MTADSNQREFTRVPSGMEVDLRFYDGTEVTGLLDNISMRGLFLPTEHRVPVGSACDVTVHLGGRGSGLSLDVKGEVARCDAEGLGIRFDEISYGAFQHLQKLVLFSSGDPEAIEEELGSHLGIRRKD